MSSKGFIAKKETAFVGACLKMVQAELNVHRRLAHGPVWLRQIAIGVVRAVGRIQIHQIRATREHA